MRITFLGTGSAWPIPRIGCECRQCASARRAGAGAPGGDARDARARSAALVEAAPGGPAVLLDAGPDIYRELAPLGRAGVARIEALVVTHVHPDHFLGLSDLAAALPRPIPLYHLEDNLPAIAGSFGYLLPERVAPAAARGGGRRTAPEMFRPRTILFGETFSIAGLEVTAFDAHHFDEFATAGLLVAAGGRRLAYAPDFKRTEADLAGLDLLALDASMLAGESFGHISIREGLALARRVAPRRTLFTHVGHVKTPHVEIEALVRREGGPSFGVAHDGLTIEI
jgi:phosphoribosyl 1,2-cyclic phosphate phosphodiesterase